MKRTRRLLAILLSALCLINIKPIATIPICDNVIVANAATKIAINKTKITLKKKQAYQLKITGTKKKAKWKSSNSEVVSVDKNGKIYAKKKGNATITATVGDKKLKCKVTVQNAKSKTYYWVLSGKVYHSTKDCPTLSRSSNIQSGKQVPKGRNACKVCFK